MRKDEEYGVDVPFLIWFEMLMHLKLPGIKAPLRIEGNVWGGRGGVFQVFAMSYYRDQSEDFIAEPRDILCTIWRLINNNKKTDAKLVT